MVIHELPHNVLLLSLRKCVHALICMFGCRWIGRSHRKVPGDSRVLGSCRPMQITVGSHPVCVCVCVYARVRRCGWVGEWVDGWVRV